MPNEMVRARFRRTMEATSMTKQRLIKIIVIVEIVLLVILFMAAF